MIQFFFYKHLKDENNIKKIHSNYMINDTYVYIKDYYNKELTDISLIDKDVIDNKIKLRGKYVCFYNITMDDILSNIYKLKLSDEDKKYKMFETTCFLSKESYIFKEKVWIII